MPRAVAPVSGRLLRRAVARLSGPDASAFLQGLVTADVPSIAARSSSYAMFLNPRGRIEFDAFITREGEDANSFLLDVAAVEMGRFLKHLKVYALRKKVDVGEEDGLGVFVRMGEGEGDVRGVGVGWRGVKDIAGEDVAVDGVYDVARAGLGVAEGVEVHGGLPLEMGVERMNGVSFSKGCYIGQELTARTFFTGEVRKRVGIIVAAERVPDVRDAMRATEGLGTADGAVRFAEEIMEGRGGGFAGLRGDKVFKAQGGRAVGKVVGGAGGVGLAVVPVDAFGGSGFGDALVCGGEEVVPIRPEWWPAVDGDPK